MTWIFSKALIESLPCSQEQEAESSEVRFVDSEQLEPWSVKRIQTGYSCSDKTMEASRRIAPFVVIHFSLRSHIITYVIGVQKTLTKWCFSVRMIAEHSGAFLTLTSNDMR